MRKHWKEVPEIQNYNPRDRVGDWEAHELKGDYAETRAWFQELLFHPGTASPAIWERSSMIQAACIIVWALLGSRTVQVSKVGSPSFIAPYTIVLSILHSTCTLRATELVVVTSNWTVYLFIFFLPLCFLMTVCLQQWRSPICCRQWKCDSHFYYHQLGEHLKP